MNSVHTAHMQALDHFGEFVTQNVETEKPKVLRWQAGSLGIFFAVWLRRNRVEY